MEWIVMARFSTLIIICSLLAMACSATQPTVKHSNETISDMGRGLNYTCRFDDGSVVVTTDPAVGYSPDIPKAQVFIKKTEYMPADVTNIDPGQIESDSQQLPVLEEVVLQTLIPQTQDWPLGTTRTVGVETHARQDLPEEERIIQLLRVKTNPKSIRYAKSIFRRVTASKAIVGEPVILHEGVIGKVVEVGNDEVHVEFEPQSDKPIDGPFGPIVVTDQGDHYRIEIDALEGDMVRVGPAVGRIAVVNDKTFRVDYAHPFGGQSLTCDTQVLAINRRTANPSQAAQVESTIDSDKAEAKQVNPRIAQDGDMATIVCTARLKSGEIVWTNRQDFAEDPKQKKIEGFKVPETFGPQTVMVGAEDLFPGMEGKLAGLKLGGGKAIDVPAAAVFGDRNPGLMRKFDRTKTVPVRATMPAQAYVKQFGGFPVPGKSVSVNAYTTGKVVDVTEQGAVLELAPVSEEEDSDFGLTRTQVVGDQIQIHLTPKLGADFNLDDKKGVVVAVDDRQFTVDFNKPMAGEDVVLHVGLIGLSKASRFAGMEIDWIEDYDMGLEAAEESNKPAVLVLYADWCSYCKKLFNTTLVDPRIKMMHDDFVWVKANSDKEKSLKMLYEQTGFPLTVVLDSSGEVLGSIKGFRPAGEYQEQLKKLVNGNSKTADNRESGKRGS